MPGEGLRPDVHRHTLALLTRLSAVAPSETLFAALVEQRRAEEGVSKGHWEIAGIWLCSVQYVAQVTGKAHAVTAIGEGTLGVRAGGAQSSASLLMLPAAKIRRRPRSAAGHR